MQTSHAQDRDKEGQAPPELADKPVEAAAEARAPALRLARAVVAEVAERGTEASSAEEAMAKAGGGQTIDLPHRAQMEHHFGCSFAHVKAFVDPEKTTQMNAKAYTHGTNITFATSNPAPDLVLHELTHVVQQTTGRQGSVAADEAEAEAVQHGAQPQVASEATPAANPQVRKDKTKPANGKLLSDTQIAGAIKFNNGHWKDVHRHEILAKLRGVPGDEFEEADVLKLAQLQKDAGVADDSVDGKAGPSTMAMLLRSGLALTREDHVKAQDVRLLFYPGEFEDLKRWNEVRKNVGLQGDETEHRRVTDEVQNDPKLKDGHGTIYIEYKGNIIDKMDARGGPPFTMKDGKDHTSDPSKAGTYKLGAGKSVVTPSWAYSQIAWGAEIQQRADGEFQFRNPGGAWQVATGADSKLKHVLSRADFHEDFDESKPVVKEWRRNDFGRIGFRVEGSPGLYIHTGPESEEAAAVGKDLALTHSHGCVHVPVPKRDALAAEGYLQKGVTLVIKKYSETLDPGSPNKK